MGITLMSGFGGVSSYYNRAYEIPTVTPEEVKKQDEFLQEKQPALQSTAKETAETQIADNRSRSADLENISLSFHKEESYDYLGSESNLSDLDIQKAISDMKKDSILQDYQYFVGSSQNLLINPADGLVIPK